MNASRSDRRRRRIRSAVGLGIVSMVGLTAAGVVFGKPRLEHALETATRKSLLDAGVGQLEPVATGDRLRIEGRVRQADELEIAREVARGQRGVRNVSLAGVIVEPASVARDNPTKLRLEARVDGDKVYLSGLTPTREAVRAVLDRAEVAFPGRVENGLTVNEASEVEIDPYRWFGSFVASLNMTGTTDMQVSVADGNLVLRGTVPSQQTADLLTQRAINFMGSPSRVVSEIVVDDSPAKTPTTTSGIPGSTSPDAVSTTGSAASAESATTTIPQLVIDTIATNSSEPPENAASVQARIDRLLQDRKFTFLPGTSTADSTATALALDIKTTIGDAPVRIEIEAYTDNTGAPGGNLRVSQARASTVARLLSEAGVPIERISAKGFGEQNPVADNSTPEGQALNRRVVVRAVDLDAAALGATAADATTTSAP